MRKANYKKGPVTQEDIAPYDEEGRLWSMVGGAPVEIKPLTPPKFEEPNGDAIEYFKKHGYVVIKGAANSDEIAQAENIFWESNEKWYGVHKEKIDCWGNSQWSCLANTRTGVVSNDSSAHSPFMWYVRGLPKIKEVFSNLWYTQDLLVSFDGYGVYRPPELYGQTRAGWFHLDQNGKFKKGMHCAQGLLNIYPSGPQDGGLVVVPGSHLQFDRWFSEGLVNAGKSDFVMLAKHPMKELWGTSPVKLCLDPGDFVIWDSRTSHCSHPAMELPKEIFPRRLRRLVAYVCMTPAQKAANLRDLREKRLDAFNNGTTLNHWPHEYHPHPTDHGGSGKFKYEPIKLNDYQMQLVRGGL